ncbi:hypothetical protein BST92_04060 [Nonlabens arenilitoris]|uniref:Gll0560 protein n=1 Tax=Nonlabens arenilitoris TaxID=1217969 RepID=A0A2S7U962_9FLAO|nr:hypothetical protein [Nonlabens arenilitoris]PQJ31147.1 hypothetical protein BST92_04060 [Nonlabens arenilitoris]
MLKHLISLLVLTITSCAQLPKQGSDEHFTFEKISELPISINESSGLIVIDGHLITHNDSGNMPILYQLDTTGIITDYVKYRYLSNHDWEAITMSDRAIHIADIGNNRGDRKDLKIYNIIKPAIWQEDIDIDISTITYAAQTNFKRRNQRHSYDAEAIIVINEVMYLFSKDWINYNTSIYTLPLYQDTSLNSHQVINTKGLVTDAAYNNKNTVLLCGYNQSLQPFVAQLNFNDDKFTLIKKVDLPIEGAQIEAIAYYGKDQHGDDIYYLTSEAVNVQLGDDEAKVPGELYKLIWRE